MELVCVLPLLNQKHDCPLRPDSVPFASTTGHHPVIDSTLGGFVGTGPFHGGRSLSTALRGGGFTTAPGNCLRDSFNNNKGVFGGNATFVIDCISSFSVS